MLFNSYIFILLVGVTFALYYLPGLQAAQKFILIAASLVFYGYGQPSLLLLLIACIAINAAASYQVLLAPSLSRKRLWAGAGVTANLLVLLFFKYSPLCARLLRMDMYREGAVGHFLAHIPLPVGISFFTFQGISLVVDVFRQKPGDAHYIQPERPVPFLIKTALFKSFFPQLVAGPIVKAHDFYHQITPKSLRGINWEAAFRSIVLGYFLKMVVADNLKDLTFWLNYPQFTGFPSLTLLALLFGYSMQIFADFAGYSLIAIGISRLFGYELLANFNFPYLAQSLSEFWRRWHISLSTWLKEYLYIPLGGNRRGEVRTYANLMIVMLLGGLWHGAAISYAVWGAFHGLGLVVERFYQRSVGRRADRSGVTAKDHFGWLKCLGVFGFVTASWLLFKLPNFRHVIAYFKALEANLELKNDPVLLTYIGLYSLPVILYHGWEWRRAQRPERSFNRHLLAVGYAVCLVAILLNSGSPGEFIYFQF